MESGAKKAPRISTPTSARRVRRGTPRKSLTPRRRHLSNLSEGEDFSSMSGREQLAAALEEANAEIAELQEGLNGGGNGDNDIVSRLALLADKVTRRRLEQKNAVLSRIEATNHLVTRVEQAKAAAVPSLSAQERTAQLSELERVHAEELQRLLSIKAETQDKADLRDRTMVELTGLKAEFDKKYAQDEEKLGFYAYLTQILKDMSGTEITSQVSDGRLKGFVRKPELHDVINFDADGTIMSRYDIVQQLWGYINNGR